MEGLLTLFVGLTAVAVMIQAGVLLAMYIVSRRISEQMELFIRDSKELMVPLKGISENLRVATVNLAEIGQSAREQFRRVEGMVADTSEALHLQLARFDDVSRNLADRFGETAMIVQDSVLKPVRQVAAIAKGVGRGFETFVFRKQRSTVDQARQDEEMFI